MNIFSLIVFFYWYFLGEGYLGYGYGELVFIAMAFIYFFILCILLVVIRRLTQTLPAVLLGMIIFDIWFASLLLGWYQP